MRRDRRRMGTKLRIVLLVAALAVLGFLALGAFGVGSKPQVEIATDRPGIGRETTVSVRLTEPRRGLAGVRIALIQGDRTEPLVEEGFVPRPPWRVWGDGYTPETGYALALGKRHQPWLVNGEATVRVEAERSGGWLRHPAPVVVETTLRVKVSPPDLAVLSHATYVAQGGSEAVVYRIDEGVTRHGVATPQLFFPGHPVPGRPGEHFALFSVPWDQPTADGVLLVAEDELGNRSERTFVDRFTPRPVATSTIRLGDDFLEKVRAEMSSRYSEVAEAVSTLDAYLWVNGDLREQNRHRLLELGADSRPEFLWDEAFLPLPGGQVMDAFAVRRTYLYEGEAVDEQTHLGYDLASVRRAEVPAANDGEVVLAEFFGIYGNCVIVDHGFGLMSLYAHLSSIDVAPGERVARGQVLGRTGATGLAGGDHLHFATLLRGLPVSSLEWWDDHWIRDRLAGKLGNALPLAREAP